MTKKEIMTRVKDFWFLNMNRRMNYLYSKLPKEKIILICEDLIKISKNIGIYTEDLPKEMSCFAIPEMSASTPNSEVRKHLKIFTAMVINLIDMCGKKDITAQALKNKYCSDLHWESIDDIIDDMREFRDNLFRSGGVFDDLIRKCEVLDAK